jgi:hypothetical protein
MLAIAADRAGRPALMLGYWMAGAVTLAALAAAESFGRVERLEFAALYDNGDPIGPMTASDSAAFSAGALIRRGGRWLKVDPSSDGRAVDRGQAPVFQARPISTLDTPGLAAMTGSPEIRFDLGFGKSAGTLAGRAPSHDIYIEIWGPDRSAQPLAQRTVLSDPKGQARFTALGVLIGTERLLGLDGGPPPKPGLAFPEASIRPAYAMQRLGERGVSIETSPSDQREPVEA